MKDWSWLFAVMVLVLVAAQGLSACGGGDDDEDEDNGIDVDHQPPTAAEWLEEITGYPWSFSEGDVGVPTPDGWRFLFAIDLDAEQSLLLDADWTVDFNGVRDFLASKGVSLSSEGLNLTGLDSLVVFAKVESGAQYPRFVQKIFNDAGRMSVDPEASTVFGAAVGSAGAGWYIAYGALEPAAFAAGTAADPCGAEELAAFRVAAEPASFYARPADDGAWALPVLAPAPRSAAVVGSGAACVNAVAVPVSALVTGDNPQCDVAGVPATCESADRHVFADGAWATLGADLDLSAGVSIPTADTAESDDFEDGDADGWDSTDSAGAACLSVDGAAFDDLFPDSDGADYAALSNGGTDNALCLAARTFTVPTGAHTLVIDYNVLTQDSPEWLDSPYADAVFAWAASGSPGFALDRSNTSASDDWAVAGAAAGVLGIAGSADAAYNETGAVWDAFLSAPGRVTLAVKSGSTLTLILGVVDTLNPWWDTALLVDAVRFE